MSVYEGLGKKCQTLCCYAEDVLPFVCCVLICTFGTYVCVCTCTKEPLALACVLVTSACVGGICVLVRKSLWLLLLGWVGKMLTLCESLSVGTVDMDPWDHVRLCLCLE